MHPSSFENMRQCRDRYIGEAFLSRQRPLRVLDLGGADVNGNYRPLFPQPLFTYDVADVATGASVTIPMADPYRTPLADESIDIVISGQAFEHIEFFWLTFAELVRVLRRDGILFLIAPSSGPEHRYPVDCYRFYPDAYRALAKHAGCELLECWQDPRGPWRDLVGVFCKDRTLLDLEAGALSDNIRRWNPPVPCPPPGDANLEAVRGDLPTRDALDRIYRRSAPRHYVHVGARGDTCFAVSGPATVIDPHPDPDCRFGDPAELFRGTADAFFRDAGCRGRVEGFDLAFIDGMPLFESALRTLMQLERLSSPTSVVLLNGVFPNHAVQASRSRATRTWAGDVWKLHRCLSQHRPDLVVVPIDAAPTGLLLVTGLDRRSGTLWDAYNPIVADLGPGSTEPPPGEVLARSGALPSDSPVVDRVIDTLRDARRPDVRHRDVLPSLRRAVAG